MCPIFVVDNAEQLYALKTDQEDAKTHSMVYIYQMQSIADTNGCFGAITGREDLLVPLAHDVRTACVAQYERPHSLLCKYFNCIYMRK